MNFAFDPNPWANFFFAEVGASAALVGLLFVAVAINLPKILEFPTLPGRALEALVILVMDLLISSFALVPGQSTRTFGCEILCTAVAAWAFTVAVQARSRNDPSQLRMWIVSRVIATQIATLPMIIAGVCLLVLRGGGLYWTVAGTVASFLAALFDAWVLLIEIQR